MSSESNAVESGRRSTLSTRRISTGRTGLILGAIVVALMLAAFALVWSRAGAS